MVRPIMRDVFFLNQKSEPATKADDGIVRDLLDTLKAHEAECVHNKAKRSCYTCGYRKGWGFKTFNCQQGVEIPEGTYMENCPNWTEDKREFDASNPYTSLFESFLGKA